MEETFNKPKELVDFKFDEISGGNRAKTFDISRGKENYIFQCYYDASRHEAKKKFDVTQRIKKLYPNCRINNVYRYKDDEKYSYIIAEKIQGEPLSNLHKRNESIEINSFKDIAITFSQIHSTPAIGGFSYFRGDNSTSGIFLGKYFNTFSEYIQSEIDWLNEGLNDKLATNDINSVLNKQNELIEYLSRNNRSKPTLTWRDLNAENIMVADNRFASIIDAGGTANIIPEYDIAFLKTNVCNNSNEYNVLLSEYKKLNPIVDVALIDKLTILTEIEAMCVKTIRNINIKTPFDPNFKTIYEKLNKLKVNN